MDEASRRKQSFLLRLPTTLRESAGMIAQSEGISLNHFISIAVAEKLSRMEQKSVMPYIPKHQQTARLMGPPTFRS
jgi:hypothetical protein